MLKNIKDNLAGSGRGTIVAEYPVFSRANQNILGISVAAFKKQRPFPVVAHLLSILPLSRESLCIAILMNILAFKKAVNSVY